VQPLYSLDFIVSVFVSVWKALCRIQTALDREIQRDASDALSNDS